MNVLWVAVLGAGAGAGLYLAGTGLLPARVPLAAVLAQLHSPALAQAPRAARVPWAERVGRLVGQVTPADHLVLGRQRSRVAAGLRLLDRSIEAHVGVKIGYAVVGTLWVGAITAVLEAGGVAVAPVLPVWLALAAGAGLFCLPDAQVLHKAARRRREFRTSLSMFVDVVELALSSGYGLPSAVQLGAQVLAGWAGPAIRTSLAAAERDGRGPWQALEALGRERGLVELVETASALSQAGTAGAPIRESLRARTQALQTVVHTDLKSQAQAATTHAVIPLALLAMATLLLVAWPMLANLALPK